MNISTIPPDINTSTIPLDVDIANNRVRNREPAVRSSDLARAVSKNREQASLSCNTMFCPFSKASTDAEVPMSEDLHQLNTRSLVSSSGHMPSPRTSSKKFAHKFAHVTLRIASLGRQRRTSWPSSLATLFPTWPTFFATP